MLKQSEVTPAPPAEGNKAKRRNPDRTEKNTGTESTQDMYC